jgi:transcriptional regulator with XRE-family HTH domain
MLDAAEISAVSLPCKRASSRSVDHITRRVCRNVAENVYRVRTSHGWTQKELADRMEVTESEVRRFEAGKTNLRVGTLARLAAALNVDTGELLQPAAVSAKRRPGRPRRVP